MNENPRIILLPSDSPRLSQFYHSLSDMRRAYKAVWDALREENLPTKEPVALFDHWFTEAKNSGRP